MDCVIDLLDIAAKNYPIKALADEIGKAESTLRNELTQQPGYKLGLKTATLILKKTGDLRALDRIESMLGRVAFIMPRAKPGDLAPVMVMAGRMAKEFGEHMQVLARSMEDGRINKKEAEECLKELEEVIEAGVKLKAYLRKIVKEESGE